MQYIDLPNYLKRENDYINNIKKGKILITYAPTYRQTKATDTAKYYEFSENEIFELKNILLKHNAIFGFRMHYFRNSIKLFNIEKYIDNKVIYDLGHNVITDIAPIIRQSDIIITDYSSVFIEALALKKKSIAFVYDKEEYEKFEDGLLYDYNIVFPGAVVDNFGKLIEAIDNSLSNINSQLEDKYKIAQKIFYKYLDCENSRRVVERIVKLI
jgi:CDP-glycerol glycerophosphotransferase